MKIYFLLFLQVLLCIQVIDSAEDEETTINPNIVQEKEAPIVNEIENKHIENKEEEKKEVETKSEKEIEEKKDAETKVEKEAQPKIEKEVENNVDKETEIKAEKEVESKIEKETEAKVEVEDKKEAEPKAEKETETKVDEKETDHKIPSEVDENKIKHSNHHNEDIKEESDKNDTPKYEDDKHLLKTLSGMTEKDENQNIKKTEEDLKENKRNEENTASDIEKENEAGNINFVFPTNVPIGKDEFQKMLDSMTTPTNQAELEAAFEKKIKGEYGDHIDHNKENENPTFVFPSNEPDKQLEVFNKIQPEKEFKETDKKENKKKVNDNSGEQNKPEAKPENKNNENEEEKPVSINFLKEDEDSQENKKLNSKENIDIRKKIETNPNDENPKTEKDIEDKTETKSLLVDESKDSKEQQKEYIKPKINPHEQDEIRKENILPISDPNKVPEDEKKREKEIKYIEEHVLHKSKTNNDLKKEIEKNKEKGLFKENIIPKVNSHEHDGTRKENVLPIADQHKVPEDEKKKEKEIEFIKDQVLPKSAPQLPTTDVKKKDQEKIKNKGETLETHPTPIDKKKKEQIDTSKEILPKAEPKSNNIKIKNTEKDKLKEKTPDKQKLKDKTSTEINDSKEKLNTDKKLLILNSKEKLDTKTSSETSKGIIKTNPKRIESIKSKEKTSITENKKADKSMEIMNQEKNTKKLLENEKLKLIKEENSKKIIGNEKINEVKNKPYVNLDELSKNIKKSQPIKDITEEELLKMAAKYDKGGISVSTTPIYSKIPILEAELTAPTPLKIEDDGTNINTTLLFAEIISRHGDRYKGVEPDETFPFDPYAVEEPFWLPYGCNQLRNKGKMRAYWLGLFLRKRYNGFLKEQYYHDDIRLTSADLDRCIDTAHLITAGLYPPKGINIWNDNVGRFYQPIPVRTLDIEDDIYLNEEIECRPYEIELDSVLQTKMKNFNLKYRYVYEYLEMYTGMNVSTLEDIAQIYTTLRIENENGRKLPEWTNLVFPDRLKMLNSYYNQIKTTSSDYFKKIQAGPLLTRLLDEIKLKSINRLKPNYKIKFWSGFDTTILKLLYTIKETQPSLDKAEDLFETDYCGSLIIELHVIKKQFFIKVLYINMDSYLAKTKAPRVIKICNNKALCPLDEFFNRMEKYRVTPKEWFEMCGMTYCTLDTSDLAIQLKSV